MKDEGMTRHLLVPLLAAACSSQLPSGIPCDRDSDCPRSHYCGGVESGSRGTCRERGTCALDASFHAPCEAGLGECLRTGILVCPDPDKAPVCSAVPGQAANEACDGRDNDCDGVTDNGFDLGAECTSGTGACARTGHMICFWDEARSVCDAEPGAAGQEVCNGLDDDCDGRTDAGIDGCCAELGEMRPCGVDRGVCRAGTQLCSAAYRWGDCVDGDGHVVVAPGTRTEICNGLDDDCDGRTDFGFDVGTACTAGRGACFAAGRKVCDETGAGTVCDAVPGIPAEEACDGVDDDCNGLTDEEGALGCVARYRDDDGDSHGNPDDSKCLCAPEFPYVATAGDDCDDARVGVHPGASEVCNGLDDDCDGRTDDFTLVLLDGRTVTGTGRACGTGACAGGRTACRADGSGIACPGEALASPERCDGADNDCDGTTDEVGADGCTDFHRDDDGDGWGVSEARCLCARAAPYTAVRGGDCDDGSEATHPGTAEICHDRIDDDCDGVTDCGDVATCAGRPCGAGTGAGAACSADRLCHEAECGNRADDDRDGATDCNDSDCADRRCAGGGACRNTICLAPPGGSVPPRGTLSFRASDGSRSGWVWSLASNASGGRIANGTYVAGSVGSVVDVVQVVDSVGSAATADVAVGPVVAIAPARTGTPPRGTLAFSATGGSGAGFAWSLAVAASGGSINPDTGGYLAGPVGGVTDTVAVVDSLGNTATAPVTVGGGVKVEPGSVSTAPRGAIAFAAHGGSGSGFVWSLAEDGSGARIDPASGLYTAGASGGRTDMVRATDSLGNIGTCEIAVGPGAFIVPADPEVPPRGSIPFQAAGGSGTGWSWSLAANGSGGGIDGATGAYTAGAAGDTRDVVSVVDSLGNTATMQISVGSGASVSPSDPSTPPRGSLTLHASGGSGSGWIWSLKTNASGGAVDESGAYTAGAIGSVVDVVRTTDSLGNEARAHVAVTAGVGIAPPLSARPPGGGETFVASGGSGTGWVWSLQSGASGGGIDASGAYVAGPVGAVTDVVRVVDSLGNAATAEVFVGESIAVAPAAPSVAPRGCVTFAATGGSGTGWVWSLASAPSGGSIVAATGAYTAGANGGVRDTVLVVDSLGNAAIATVDVTVALSLQPASASLPPRGSLVFSAAGGAGGNAWSLGTDDSGARVDASTDGSTATYRAGPRGDAIDVVRVADTLGSVATATVTVGPAVAVTPPGANLPPQGALAFSASGGSGTGWIWSLAANRSGASIDASGGYVAGDVPSATDVVKAIDSLGNEATAEVSVGPGISVLPAVPGAPPRGAIAFSASGGSGTGWHWVLASNGSGASIGEATGAYVAGAAGGTVDTVTVADSLGNTATVQVAVGSGAGIAPSSPSVPPRASVAFAATGGSGTGWTWTLASNGSGGTIGATGAYVAGATGGVADVVQVTDSLGNSATATITVTTGATVSPANWSTRVATTKSFSASGGSGTGWIWSLAASPSAGFIGATTGLYSAGTLAGVTDVVRATDSLGNVATASVAVTPGLPNPTSSRSTVVAAPASNVWADGVAFSTIDVTVRDSYQNPVPGCVVMLSCSGIGCVVTQPTAATDAGGRASGRLTATRSGTKQVLASVAGTGSLQQRPTVVFVQAPSATHSLATATPLEGVVANGLAASTISVTVRDMYDLPIVGATVALSAGGSGNGLSTPGPTDAGGRTSATLSSTRAETKVVTVTVAGTVVLAAMPAVTFVAGAPDAAASSLTAVPDVDVAADGTAAAALVLTARDAFGNPVSGAAVVFAATGLGNSLVQPAGTTGADGIAGGSLASTKAEAKTASALIGGTVTPTAKPTVVFVAGPPDPLVSTMAASPTQVLADGVRESKITVAIADSHGNPVSGAVVVLSATGSGTVLTQPGPTDAGGLAAGAVASSVAETKTIRATVGGTTTLAATLAVTFGCGTATCPDGCCVGGAGGVCLAAASQSALVCGAAGASCISCDPVSDLCATGACAPDRRWIQWIPTTDSRPPGSFMVDTLADTVTDLATGLVWQRSPGTTLRPRSASAVYCSGLSQAGGGWRLPTRIELLSIVDLGRNPAVDTGAFAYNGSTYPFWTASDFRDTAGYAWTVSFTYGRNDPKPASGPGRSWCVR